MYIFLFLEIHSNGIDASPNSNFGNNTITSSLGDITIDSVRDHLNNTTTTLCSTTTEEIVGRLSVLSTTTNNTVTSINPKEMIDVVKRNSFKEIIGNTNENQQNSVIVKSVITTISHGTGVPATNGNADIEKAATKVATTTITRKESQF